MGIRAVSNIFADPNVASADGANASVNSAAQPDPTALTAVAASSQAGDNAPQTQGQGQWREIVNEDGTRRIRWFNAGEDTSNTNPVTAPFYEGQVMVDGELKTVWVHLNMAGPTRNPADSDFLRRGWVVVDKSQVPPLYTTEGRAVFFSDNGELLDGRAKNQLSESTLLRRYIQTYMFEGGMYPDDLLEAVGKAQGRGVRLEVAGEPQLVDGQWRYEVRISKEDLAKLREVQAEMQQKFDRVNAAVERAKEETTNMMLDFYKVQANGAINVVNGATKIVGAPAVPKFEYKSEYWKRDGRAQVGEVTTTVASAVLTGNAGVVGEVLVAGNTATAATEAVTGEDLRTGEKLTPLQQTLSAVGAVAGGYALAGRANQVAGGIKNSIDDIAPTGQAVITDSGVMFPARAPNANPVQPSMSPAVPTLGETAPAAGTVNGVNQIRPTGTTPNVNNVGGPSGTLEPVLMPVTREEYAELRARTPSREIRESVNEGEGAKVDPVYKYRVERYEADHIVSLKEITEMPGFDKLTRQQQLEVVNLRENFVGLGKATNASKQDKTWAEWVGHSKLGPVPPEVRAWMLELEGRARGALRTAIDERLKQNEVLDANR